MKTKRTKQGFTIMEILVSMIAFSVMMLIVSAMLIYGWRGWRNNTESVSMQRDAVLAMEQIAREIRNSNIAEITDNAAGIYFAPGIVRSNAVNILASDIAYLPGVNISGFNVSTITNAVTVRFTLFTDDNSDRNDYEITVNTRN